jgi:signal transduction histidine kinase
MTATVLLSLAASVYFFSRHHAREYFFTRLKVRASITAESHYHVNHTNGTIVREIRERHLQLLPQEQHFFFETNDHTSTEIQKKLPVIPGTFVADLTKNKSATFYDGFWHYAGIIYPANGHIVIASAYDESAEDQITFLRNLLIFGLLISSAIVFVLGRVFAYRIIHPISAIIEKVHDITSRNLSERLPKGTQKDEVADIADTFNSMLDRLETTFELQKNFISNASHELQTPLTAILGEAEVILQTKRKCEDYENTLKVIYKEAKRLDEITTSLLRLSQISYDGRKQKIEPILMDELIMSIKINLDKRIPSNKVKILVQPVEEYPEIFTLVCVRVWMELALTNIIQNSIKYSDNKEVLVTLSVSEQDFFIHISDYGIGIPEKDIEHIFEPFFRGSNTSNYTGYGIGLPLAERIIRLHGGKFHVHSKANVGTKVTLQFPQQIKI